MKLPKLAIFDMDGLLFDTERLFRDYLIETAAIYGYTFTPQMYLNTVGLSGPSLVAVITNMLGPEYPLHEISSVTQKKILSHIANNPVPIKKGVPQLLTFFQQKKVPCCVASSTKTEHVRQYLESTSLNSFFSFVIGGDQVKISKPDPEIFLKSCNHFQISPSDSMVFEDSPNGILAGYSANIPVICVPDLIVPSKEISLKTKLILNQIDEIIPLFDQ